MPVGVHRKAASKAEGGQKLLSLDEELTLLNEEDSDLRFSENSKPTECNPTTLRTLRRMRIQRSEHAESLPSLASSPEVEYRPQEAKGGEKSKRLQEHLSLLSV